MAHKDDILYLNSQLGRLKKHEAVEAVAKKIKEMQVLYQEVMALADEHDLKVAETLRFPDDMRLGHNENMHAEIWWNPSSKYC